jgi:hypothetical protein
MAANVWGGASSTQSYRRWNTKQDLAERCERWDGQRSLLVSERDGPKLMLLLGEPQHLIATLSIVAGRKIAAPERAWRAKWKGERKRALAQTC